MEKRERLLLILLSIAVVGAGFYYGYTFFWGNYVAWGEQIEQNVQRIQEAQRKAAQIEQLVEEVKVTTRELKEARRQLPREGEFYSLLAKLESQARNSGIPDDKIITFSRTQTQTDGIVRTMAISAKFQEIGFEETITMLWRFENMERLIDLQRFDLSPVETNSNSFRFDLNLVLNVYMLQDEAEGEEA